MLITIYLIGSDFADQAEGVLNSVRHALVILAVMIVLAIYTVIRNLIL
jgi:hypothetical protein